MSRIILVFDLRRRPLIAFDASAIRVGADWIIVYTLYATAYIRSWNSLIGLWVYIVKCTKLGTACETRIAHIIF
jgi:hypothetical protein